MNIHPASVAAFILAFAGALMLGFPESDYSLTAALVGSTAAGWFVGWAVGRIWKHPTGGNR